jgi:bifunctional DNase/RNase
LTDLENAGHENCQCFAKIQKPGVELEFMGEMMLRPMVIWALAVDSLTNSPIVILKEVDGERTLPIWIGLLEASAIVSGLKGVKLSSRPMTHDLLKNIMDLTGVKVSKIEICDLQNNIYYALIYIDYKGRQIPVDARPSDALALSLKVSAPVFATETVIQKSKQIDLEVAPTDRSEDGKKWQEILQSLNPEDFGKYKM